MEEFSKVFVLIAYLAVVVNGVLLLQKTNPGWHRKWALRAMLPAAVFWTLFYGHIEFIGSHPSLPAWSRLGHTLTVGAFMAQQFLISTASEDQVRALKRTIEQILKEPTDE